MRLSTNGPGLDGGNSSQVDERTPTSSAAERQKPGSVEPRRGKDFQQGLDSGSPA